LEEEMSHFTDKLVVLTGVGRAGQVGEVIARAFAERGARVVLLDRDPAVADRAAELRAFGARAFQCDLTDAGALARVAAQIAEGSTGGVHALVNVAGGFAMSRSVAESDPAILERQIAINLTTAYLSTRAMLPLLRPARGSIVYFASAAVLPGASGAGMSAYAIAKSGVLALMRAVADEERGSGVRANALAPTSIRTDANVQSMGDGVRYVEREAVADAVLFLCSDAARNVSGQVVALS
jgi:NAD(P)-dependent dehydrogenase (short-subunit alcohol dehydrogenase family)